MSEREREIEKISEREREREWQPSYPEQLHKIPGRELSLEDPSTLSLWTDTDQENE